MENLANSYRSDGFVHVTNALPKNAISSLTDLIELNIDKLAHRLYDDNRISELYSESDFGRRFYMIATEANLHNAFLRWDAELVSEQLYNLVYQSNEKKMIRSV